MKQVKAIIPNAVSTVSRTLPPGGSQGNIVVVLVVESLHCCIVWLAIMQSGIFPGRVSSSKAGLDNVGTFRMCFRPFLFACLHVLSVLSEIYYLSG